MDLEEIGINAGNWVDSAQDRNYWRALANAALNLRVHKLWSYLVRRIIILCKGDLVTTRGRKTR